MPNDVVPFILLVPGDIVEQLLISFDSLCMTCHVVCNISPLNCSFFLILQLLSGLQTPLGLVNVELLTNNHRLDCFAAALEHSLPHEHNLLCAALMEHKELIAFLVRVEEDMSTVKR